MSSLVLTIEEDVESEQLEHDNDSEFELGDSDDDDDQPQPPSNARKSTKAPAASAVSRKRKTPAPSFLSDLADISGTDLLVQSESSAALPAPRSRREILYERAQDRLAMRKFNREQRKERGEEVSDSEDDHAPEQADDSDSGSDDGAEVNRSSDETNDAEDDAVADAKGSNKPRTPRPARTAPAPVAVIEWRGTKESLKSIKDFAELKLSKPLLRAVADLGFIQPTPVQSAVIPYALAGRDLLANAMTGSGKTAAFVLPILERLLHRSKRVPVSRVLVLLPTRELAVQCQQMTVNLARYTDIRTCLVVGGMSESVQENELKQRPDIVIATPGRIIDHLRNSHSVHFDDLEVLVLDEADRLLELGFIDELKEIIRLCPKQRQTLLFSATLSHTVSDLVLLSLNEPMRVTIDSNSTIVNNLTQEFVRLHSKDDGDREREAIILSLCKRSFRSKTLIFVSTKDSCHRLFLLFSLSQLSACELQGSLTQLQRLEALQSFKTGAVNFLICTDLASRGLDITGVETVINMHMPSQLKTYIHRVGRTARAGRVGRAVTLVGKSEKKQLKLLLSHSETDKVHSRIIPQSVIDAEIGRIEKFQPDIASLMGEEKMEKAERVAEAELNRAHNKLIHEAEIHMRPRKTWFQNEQEKLAAKLSAVRNFDAKALLFNKQPRLVMDDSDDDGDGDRRKSKKKKDDPFRGMSREQKRKKKMRMEAEEFAKERREQREADESVGMAARKPVNDKAAAKRAKLQAKGDWEQRDEPAAKKRKMPAGPKFADDVASVDKRYRVRARDAAKEAKSESTKSFKAKSKSGSFKSKSKHKRR